MVGAELAFSVGHCSFMHILSFSVIAFAALDLAKEKEYDRQPRMVLTKLLFPYSPRPFKITLCLLVVLHAHIKKAEIGQRIGELDIIRPKYLFIDGHGAQIQRLGVQPI